MPSTSVVVNQLASRGPNGISDEFIELRNISDVDQDISGWKLEACNTDGTETLLTTMPANTVLEPKGQVGQFFLVANSDGYSAATAADRTYSMKDIQDAGGVRLLNNQAPAAEIDAVGFTDGLDCTETAAAQLQVPATDPAALANARNIVSTDTDVNQIDFRQLPRSPHSRFS